MRECALKDTLKASLKDLDMQLVSLEQTAQKGGGLVNKGATYYEEKRLFSHLGFWSGNLFLIAPFADLCLLVPFL